MIESFREDRVSSSVSTLDSTSVVFDFALVDAILGNKEEPEGPDYGTLAYALRRIIIWLLRDGRITKTSLNLIGKRVVALAWTIDPQLLEGRSLARIARGASMSAAALSWHSAAASRRFKVANRSQWQAKRRKG